MSTLLQSLSSMAGQSPDRTGLPATHDANTIPGADTGDSINKNPDNLMRDMQENSDKRNIISDNGDITGFDKDNAWKQWIQQGANHHGDLQGFLYSLFGDKSPASPGTPGQMVPNTGTATPSDISRPPEQPTQDFSAPRLLPPQLVPQARADVLKQSGLNPDSYSTVPGAEILRKQMTEGDVRGKEYDQNDQATEISDAFRKPQQIEPLRTQNKGKGDRLQLPKQPALKQRISAYD